MKKRTTISALLAIVLSACSGTHTTGENTTSQQADVTIYTTTGDRSQNLQRSSLTFASEADTAGHSIRLHQEQHYQTMDGFGAAITGSSAYNLLKMDEADRKKFLTETFSTTEGYGQSYIRIAIGCSDFSLSEYTLNDEPGMEHFALQEEETKYVIPVLKEILAINPNIKILGSPWTPPRWMKVNNLTDLAPYDSWTGGHLNPKYYQDYGTYFVKWIQAMEAAGVPIYAVTPQNEPLNHKNSASMLMFWTEQRDFVKTALGPKLKEAGLQTKIYAFDHNYNYDNMPDQADYPVEIYKDAEAAAYFAGAAYHNYGGNREELIDIHNKAPEKELIFTETSIGTWNDGQNLDRRLIEDMQEVGLGTINNWSKAVIVWNLMLDSDRGPNREGGCKTCYGAVDIQAPSYKEISRNSHYYVISHLSAVVQPGAVRIGSEGLQDADVMYSAFKNPDGSLALVLVNAKKESYKLNVSDGKHQFSYEVPARSVVSYKWQ